MSSHRRGVVAFLVAAGCVTLAGCGDNGTAAGNSPAEVRETSYVTIEPATTTTTLPAADTTVPSEGAISTTEQTYVIEGGDTVWGIADKHGITIEQLVTYNEWADGQNHLLIAGQEVRIPPGATVAGSGGGTGSGSSGNPGATTPSGGGATTPPEPESEGCIHVVVANDNQGRVANQYDVPLDALAQANASNPAWNHFQLGSEIIIPGGGDCP